MKKLKIRLVIKNFFAMLGANFVGTIATLIFALILKNFISNDIFAQSYFAFILFVIVTVAVNIAVSTIMIYLYFKRKISDVEVKPYNENLGSVIYKTFLSTVFPAEIIRFILLCIPTKLGSVLGMRFFDGFFAFAPNFIYDQFYVAPNGLHSIIRERGFTFGDNMVFILVYLMYFVINTLILLIVYRHVWKAIDKECNGEHHKEIKR